jgi:hypothetical protein
MPRQKLLTAEIRTKIPKLYAQENEKDPMVYAKFFCPWNSWTWFATEGEAVDDGKDFKFFGMVHGQEKELGYFLLSELESVRGRFGLRIERDMYFEPCRLSEAK